ncbi:MAG: hypothetical protein WBG92_02050 [Thiohalocapsa sp.]
MPVLRWFARSGLIEPEDVREMLAWENSGFSLDAAVRVGSHDRAGVRRLLFEWLGPSISGLDNIAARSRRGRDDRSWPVPACHNHGVFLA